MVLKLKPFFCTHQLWLGAALLLFIGCSNQSVVKQPTPPAPPPLPVVNKVADKNFDTETFYALLVAEFAGDRERFDVMLNNYVQQAKATQDLEVTARAARVARFLNVHDASLAMALQWAELEPGSLEAHLNATLELVEANQVVAAFDHARLLAEQGEPSGLDAIAARALQIGDPGINQDLQDRYKALEPRAPKHAPLLIGLSLLQQQSEELDAALANALRAQSVDPESFQAQAQEVRVLQQMGREEQALTKLGELVERHPTNQRLRLQYARSLVKVDVEQSLEQFQALLAANPSDPDMQLTVALIQYELGQYARAKGHFLLLTEDTKRKNTAHAYLGRILAGEGDNQGAIRHLQQVVPGSDYLPALAKLTDVYLAQGKPEQALGYLSNALATDVDDDTRSGITLLQSSVYTRTGEAAQAIELLSEALQGPTPQPGLLYARAMLYTQQDELAAAERDLKEVLAADPNHAAALNALGYTLADRTNRIDEAYDYIQRAYALTPNDPAVIDSLGWVEYRRGNLPKALQLLKRAMQAMPDHEIAAHLGEVLWVTGEQQLAREIWQQGLQLMPESPIIKRTIERLNAGQAGQP